MSAPCNSPIYVHAKACRLLCGSLWWLLVMFSPAFSSGPVRCCAAADELCLQLLQWESVGVVDHRGCAVRPLCHAGVSLLLQRRADGCLCVAARCLAAVVSMSAVPAVTARHGDSEGVRVLQFHLVLLWHRDEGAPGEGVAETGAEPAGRVRNVFLFLAGLRWRSIQESGVVAYLWFRQQ